ncbi:MAG: U32 family peptidase [Clostridiales bacterium]|jgi:putative protease|nr:U32 family peptidase [Clostridiales bacterium]
MNRAAPEILAPAGGPEQLRAAVNNGADAVYLGLKEFNARDKAQNFDLDELKAASRYARLFGVKIYVALNTLIKNDELSRALSLADGAYGYADAFIVQDLGFARELKKRFPDIILHASTQAGVHNAAGAKFMEASGFSRVVLSRETLLEDIRAVKTATALELEFFVQGAMCVSFSGNCYFSSLVSGYGGNRGKCLQLCRKRYCLTLGGGVRDSGYLLSPKDLYMAERLPRLIDAGITSFKIEGRLRRPEYVAAAVRAYKNALAAPVLKEDTDALKLMFNRGDYCTAHIDGPTANIICKELQGHCGLKIGAVKTVKNGAAVLDTSRVLQKGDGVKFVRNGAESGTAEVIRDGAAVTFKGAVRAGDEARLTTDTALIKSLNAVKRFIGIDARAELRRGQKAKLILTYNGITAQAESEQTVEAARDAGITAERIDGIITAAGTDGVNITVKNLAVDGNIFIPVSALKTMRRKCVDEIVDKIIAKNAVKTAKSHTMSDITYNFRIKSGLFVQIESMEQAAVDGLNAADYVVFNPSEYSPEPIGEFYGRFGERAVLNLPAVCRGADADVLRRCIAAAPIKTFIVNNPGGIEFVKDKNIIFGAFMNCLNDALDVEKIASVECERLSQTAINYIFGRFPLMTFTHCVKKSALGACPRDCGGYKGAALTDETRGVFPLRRVKLRYCYGQLLNGTPIYLADKCAERALAKRFIDLTGYGARESEGMLKTALAGAKPEFAHTRGRIEKTLF